MVYKAVVKVEGEAEEKIYVGQTTTTFKQRLASHKNTMRYIEKRKSTVLSDFIWETKENGKISKSLGKRYLRKQYIKEKPRNATSVRLKSWKSSNS